MNQWYTRARRYGVWPMACALVAAMLVTIIPLFLLIMAGVLVGAAVYLIVTLFVWVVTTIQDAWARIRGPRDDVGRRNVRVID